MKKGNIVSLEDRIPKIKQQRKRKANRRLILLLSIFFLLIVCVAYFQSPFSKVNKIEVTGNSLLSNQTILKNSKIKKGMNVWGINRKETQKRLTEMPEVKKAKVSVHLPNNITIHISEYGKIAYLAKGTSFLPVLENGKIIRDAPMKGIPVNSPILSDFLQGNVLNEMVKELGKVPDEIVNSISEIQYTPKKTDKYHITLFMNDGFEVSATIRTFAGKMVHYPSIISQLDPNKKGVIDLEVGSFFKAYDSEGENQNEKKEDKR
ncbi:cell division protein FtsQ/DivIB [Falsibacillus albus]|uniref:Cell division protein DivIB n=1 Tax=Falsibacillus albus TaxID=2478915 RepID=A0A3L7K0B4_9BACI|nr:FtsQ-type POTRA domain-containing protein [Falsibacillus albus]RLQ95829.1 FtsQ-type POTRA domain-containing protein [Falsibacillus albus]